MASASTYLDHLTHNVHRGHMEQWADFYERIFNFREIRYFDIEGKLTGLLSKAMTSPDGKIRIPLNESADDKSQIEEYLAPITARASSTSRSATDDIYRDASRHCAAAACRFRTRPDTYYDAIDTPLPGHGEDLARLQRDRILIDGAPTRGRACCCRSSPRP